MRRTLIWSAVLLQFVLVAVASWVLYNRHKVARAALEAVAELDRSEPGWRLKDLEAARDRIPEEENSARVVVAARRLLPPSWPPQELSEPLDRLPPPERLPPEQAARLEAELRAVAPAVTEARKLAGLPRGRHHITYRHLVINTLLEDQESVRAAAALLKYDALRRAHAGDMAGALASCRAALNAGRSIGDEPTAISQLIRNAGVTLACHAAERVLAQGEAGPDDLAALQRAFEEEDRHPGLLVSMRGERAAQYELYDAVEKGEVDPEDFSERPGPPEGGPAPLGWALRDRFRSELPPMLALMARHVEVSRLPPHQQAEAERQISADAERLARDKVLTKLLVPSLNRVGEAERRRHANVRCIAVALAVERYRRQRGDWPESLAKLTPEFLKEVPLDPFDGRPLRYRQVEDGAVVYSVGPDGRDNGGRFDRENPTRAGADLGFGLWDVKHRRRPPGPVEKPPQQRAEP
jgi:hypothetical protein